MASIVEESFKELRVCIHQKQGTRAKLCIENVLRSLKGEISSSEIGLSIVCRFNTNVFKDYMKNH